MSRLEQGNNLPGGGMRQGGSTSSGSSGGDKPRSPSSSFPSLSYQPAVTAAAAPIRAPPLAAAITVEFRLCALLPAPTLALAHSYSARLVDMYKTKIPADRYSDCSPSSPPPSIPSFLIRALPWVTNIPSLPLPLPPSPLFPPFQRPFTRHHPLPYPPPSFSRSYDQSTKHWVFPLALHDTLLSLLRDLPPSFPLHLKPLPPFLITGLSHPTISSLLTTLGGGEGGRADALLEEELLLSERLPGRLREAMKPYQKEGIQYAIRRGGRALIGGRRKERRSGGEGREE